jgi:carboxyl-terminal processing protease
MVVIQNGKTAGVAEVFSAALRDTEVARIVGTVSMGMGVGQRDIPLSDGTAIRLSTYEYVTPAGERFNKTGIEPTITSNLDSEKEARFFELTDEEDDELQTALNQLKEMMGMQ